MNLFKITLVLMFAAGIGFHPASNQAITTLETDKITVQNLSKKWKLEKYKVSFFSEAPSEKEKNDYIHLKSDMTFSIISEGEFGTGNWRLDARRKRIYLFNKNEEGELIFIIDELKLKKLVLIIDDSSDSDAKYLKIHFKI